MKKIPRKLRPMGLAFVVAGFLAAASVFAAQPASPGGVNLPGVKFPVPAYMIVAANLDDAEYMNCVAARAQNDKNVIESFEAALACRGK